MKAKKLILILVLCSACLNVWAQDDEDMDEDSNEGRSGPGFLLFEVPNSFEVVREGDESPFEFDFFFAAQVKLGKT